MTERKPPAPRRANKYFVSRGTPARFLRLARVFFRGARARGARGNGAAGFSMRKGPGASLNIQTERICESKKEVVKENYVSRGKSFLRGFIVLAKKARIFRGDGRRWDAENGPFKLYDYSRGRARPGRLNFRATGILLEGEFPAKVAADGYAKAESFRGAPGRPAYLSGALASLAKQIAN